MCGERRIRNPSRNQHWKLLRELIGPHGKMCTVYAEENERFLVR